jgi:non-specific serine/threonine protein kinase/serine/threonine-protein kinase
MAAIHILAESIMENSDQTQSFAAPLSGAGAPSADAVLPHNIGPYRLIERIGEGGMGTVYKADQLLPVKRTVAIKLIKLGLDSAEIIARFESERQALARMDHPNIAKVLDAGMDERGRPYFVMEYVPGTPITKYADDNQLSIRQRLELVLQVCDAIGHAHAKAIIHRDIKAGNVLAYTADGKPTVKVIDFGIAKALTGDRLTDRTFNTAMGQAIGTYESMSPEQADGSPDIDTRTDVYSLGALLYELLSGSKPFDQSNLARAVDAEIRRIIREDEPPRPSTQLSSKGEHATRIAKARQVEVQTLTRQLQSELEWIPLMALRKERSRRYATPQQMAEDIQNYLAGIPLIAAPDSRTYRLRKFVRRNRRPIIAVLSLLIGLMIGIVGTTVGLLREKKAKAAEVKQRIVAQDATAQAAAALAEEKRQRAIAEDQRARAVARLADAQQMASSMFKFDDALLDVPGSTATRKLIADSALKYLDHLSHDAAARAQVLRDLAISYGKVGDVFGNPDKPNVGDTDQALASYEKALKIFQKLAADDPADPTAQHDLAIAYERMGTILSAKRKVDSALANYSKSLAIFQKLAQEYPDNPRSQRALAVSYVRVGDLQVVKGQNDAGMQSYQKSLDIMQKLLQISPANAGAQRDVAVALIKLADIQAITGRNTEALANYLIAQQAAQRRVANEPSNTLARRDLAAVLDKMGSTQSALKQIDQALNNYRKSLEIRQKLDHDDPGNAMVKHGLSDSYSNIGYALAKKGQLEDALQNYRTCLDLNQSLTASDPGNVEAKHEVAVSHFKLALLRTELADRTGLTVEGKLSQLRPALADYRDSLQLYRNLQANGTLEPADQATPAKVEAELRKCEDGISRLEKQSATQPTTIPAPATQPRSK